MSDMFHERPWPIGIVPEKRPEAGDLVISCAQRTPHLYAVSVTPEPPHIHCGSYDEALSHARRLAASAHVDVWVLEESQDVALVARHRTQQLPRSDRER